MFCHLFPVFLIVVVSSLPATNGFLLVSNNFMNSMLNASTSAMSHLTSFYGSILSPFGIKLNPMLTGNALLKNPLLTGSGSPSTGSNPLVSGTSLLTGGSPLTGNSLLTGGAATGAGNSASPLGQYNVDKSQISVSGISAGAIMATQMHVIHSKTFMGAGIIAGVPYACSGGNMMTAISTCMNMPQMVSPPNLEQVTETRASGGHLDPVVDMTNDKVYIFSGAVDTVVKPENGHKIEEFYRHFISNPSNIKTVFNVRAQHGQPTNNYGAGCASTMASSPYIINCQYSAAYDLLNFIYGGNLKKPSPEMQVKGQLLRFNQGEFSAVSMDSVGYVYIPTGCANKTTACKLHVAFHGCKQGQSIIGDVYARHAGYNEVGELNNIIILYPQATTTMTNFNGCWDWWGYSGSNFDTNDGAQPKAIMSMLHRITG